MIEEFKYNNEKEKKLIEFTIDSVNRAERNHSNIVLDRISKDLYGMTSSRIRHLLNNLCSLKDTILLDLGSFRGSSAISAAWKNDSIKVYAVDKYNFDPYGSPSINKDGPWPTVLKSIKENIKLFSLQKNIEIVVSDMKKLNSKIIPEKVNVCFYDASPSITEIKKTIEVVTPLLDEYCIFICSNTKNLEMVKSTEKAFIDNDITVVWNKTINSRVINDKENWWNGLKIWLIQNPKSFKEKFKKEVNKDKKGSEC